MKKNLTKRTGKTYSKRTIKTEDERKIFIIKYGVPGVRDLMSDLLEKKKAGTLTKSEKKFTKKLTKCICNIKQNPFHPGLNSHEISVLTKRYGVKVFVSYLENKTPAAGRIFWIYGPETKQITIVAIEKHPPSNKAYSRVNLDDF